MWQNTIHGGGAPEMRKSVYYTGSDTLREGYALCFDFNAFDVNQENVAQTTPNVGEEAYAPARRLLVEKCTEQNKIHFAGVVSAESDDVTGPGWIWIHCPGSVCSVFTASDVDSETPTAGTEGAGTAVGELVNIVVGQYYFKTFGMPGSGAALVLQDVDRSSVNGLVMAELMTGQPSGGLNIIGSQLSTHNGVELTTATTLSNLLGYVPAMCGTYVKGLNTVLIPILSFPIAQSDGRWNGQRMAVYLTNTLSVAVSVLISGYLQTFVTDITGGQNVRTLTSVVLELSTDADFMVLEFDGLLWRTVAAHENMVS